MKTITFTRWTPSNKFTRSIEFYGSDFPFFGFKETGCWGMYINQVRRKWFGIKYIGGFCYVKAWQLTHPNTEIGRGIGPLSQQTGEYHE